MIFTLLQPSSPKWVGHLAYSLTQRVLEKVQVGHLAYFIYTRDTRNAPSGSTGLFIHIHKGDRRWSKWVIWLIHSYTQRGSEMVQVGHLAYSFIYTKRIRDGPSGSSSLFSYTKGTGDCHLPSLLMCSKGPDKSEGHRCFVFLKTWTFCRVFQQWQANPQTRHNGSNCLLLTHLYWEVMGGVGGH
jgi:hypothetical protein